MAGQGRRFTCVVTASEPTEWKALHREAMVRVKALDEALAAGDWVAVDGALTWIYTELRAHNLAEEAELFPLLEELGADELREELLREHREMWDLVLQLLAGIDEGKAPLPDRERDLGHRLVVLIRGHIETEERLLLPLLKGRTLPIEDLEEGYLILEKRPLAPGTWSFVVRAPMVARGRKPGQFLMVIPFPKGERIPLTLASGDASKGWIRFVMQEAGATTRAMARLNAGDRLFAVAGPMGQPTELVAQGTVALVAGGYGSAAILSAAEALKARGQRVLVILGGRSKDRVLLTDELEAASDELIIVTDDGSWGRKGLVTDALRELMEREPIAQVVAVGPVPMMEAVSNLTRPGGVKTLVSLNATMVDGTGMCGGCRVVVGGAVKFACFEGPDFDGHQVDFQTLRGRQGWYREQEQRALEADHACNLGLPENATADVQFPDIEAVADFDWKTADLLNLKASQRMTIPRQAMATLEAEPRTHNFCEVNLGFSPDQAKLEAARCLQCRKPACVDGCPVGIDIPRFIREIAAGEVAAAGRTLKESSSLPAVCGRVCPQECQCEKRCVVGIKDEAVSIGRLERFAADALLKEAPSVTPPAPTGKRVAIVGAGPSGLTAAGELARHGHAVTVFDALHRPGGVLVYGIPEFRLPNAIVDAEVDGLRQLGVRFVLNTLVGRSLDLAELRAEFDAVFLGTGAGLPRMLNVSGEALKGIYTANEFLTRINLMGADRFPDMGTPVTVGQHVIIVGCGNTAMDCARAARRLGHPKVTVVYRRTEAESTARVEEVLHAKEEGIEFRWLVNPVRIHGSESGWIQQVDCAEMELGEPGPDGRRSPVPTGRELTLECDTLVVALGFAVNPLLARTEPGLRTLRGGVVVVDEDTGETSLPGVYAGGDVITGGATVILAMGQARRAAAAIHRRLSNV